MRWTKTFDGPPLKNLEQSNGDVTSGLKRPLAARISITPLSTVKKTLLTTKGFEDRQEMSEQHEEKTMVSLSNGDIISCYKRPQAAEVDIPPFRTIKNVTTVQLSNGAC
jgi:hypothetical protein